MAQLHIDSLSKKRNVRDIRRALANLPQGLDATYDDVMNRISSQDEEDCGLAKRVLGWIVYAKRPLTPDMLEHAVAFTPDCTELDEDALIDFEQLICVCAGLVVLDREVGTVRLVHYTTQDYFVRNGESMLSDAPVVIAKTCLHYISLVEDFSPCDGTPRRYNVDHDQQSDKTPTGDPDNKEYVEARTAETPLLPYVIDYWSLHARQQERDMLECILEFFAQKYKLRFLTEETLRAGGDLGQRISTNLCVAALFGLRETIQLLLGAGIDVSEADDDDWKFTPLHYAALYGHESVVRLLLQRGANIDAEGLYGFTPLRCAAMYGHEPVVRLLLAQGVGLDMRTDQPGGNSITDAINNGYESIVRLLLDYVGDSRDYVQGQTSRIWIVGHPHHRVELISGKALK